MLHASFILRGAAKETLAGRPSLAAADAAII
jgi:hypothetical protein